MNAPDAAAYLHPEAAARTEIDEMLEAAGWSVQDYQAMALGRSTGVAVREFPMATGHGVADYLLFVKGRPVGVIEAKKPGTTLTGVEYQSKKYADGLPEALDAFARPLPFAYESTGHPETRFTNGLDPEPRSRRVFSFHRPETLGRMLDDWVDDPDTATLNERLRHSCRRTCSTRDIGLPATSSASRSSPVSNAPTTNGDSNPRSADRPPIEYEPS